MKIKKVIIHNFRAFKNAEFEFDDFNCIVGKNDSGKSTVLAALEWFFSTKNLEKYDVNVNAQDKKNTLYVKIYFSDVDFHKDLFDKDFLDENGEVCITKKMANPRSIDSDIVKPFPYYCIQTNCFSNRKKIFTNTSLEDLMEECISRKINAELLSKKLSILRNCQNEKDLYLSKIRMQEYKPLMWQALYDYYSKCNYKVSIGQKKFSVERWFEWLDESCYFYVPIFELYTPLTPIKTYLNRLFNHRFIFDEEKTNDIANDIANKVFENRQSKKHSLFFDYLECDYFPNSTKLPLLSMEDSEIVSLQNRGDGFLQKIKNAVFRIFVEKGYKSASVVFAFEEPETHLHPSAQRDMYDTIKALSSTYQVIITTHSPYIVKELSRDKVNTIVVKRDEKHNESKISKLDEERVLPYESMNEINYIAFDYASEEFHQELYGKIEIDWFGESNGSKMDQIINCLCKCKYKPRNRKTTFAKIVSELMNKCNLDNHTNWDLLHNTFISPDKKTDDHSLCHCVRNAIDHPCEGNSLWKHNRIVELSIKILMEVNNFIVDIDKQFQNITSTNINLDDYGKKIDYFVDCGNNIFQKQTHSIVYWTYYCHYTKNCNVFEDQKGKKSVKKNMMEVKNALEIIKVKQSTIQN